MKNKKIFFTITIIIFLIFLIIIFYKNLSKISKIGHTNTSQEIVDNILNISSYEAVIEVEVNSNKNTNKYTIKQKYISPDISEQEIIEPENIQGIKITKKDNELKVENSKINMSKIYNDYEYMTDNCLDLNTFIENYKLNKKQIYEEDDDEIILNTENENNKYTRYQTLYIDRKTGKPTKLEIKDNSKNTSVYILYREVKLK